LPIAATAYVGLGDLHRERTDLDGAVHDLTLAIDLCQQWGNVEILAEAHSVLARVWLGKGDLARAVETLEQAKTLIQTHDIEPRIVADVSNCEVRVRLASGDFVAAQRRLSEPQLSVNDERSFQREAEQILLARVLLARGRQSGQGRLIEEVSSLLQRLLQAAEAGGRIGRIIEILVLQAMAQQARSIRVQAIDSLARALVLAQPEGYIRVFLDEGPPMTRLLQDARASARSSAYVTQLLADSEDTWGKLRDPSGSMLRPEELAEPLTERELEVLRLVAAGLSNSQIAKSLTITVGTAKRHVNNIYDKLSVGSRTQAVARARELQLL
jgi:LuxR family maltose regulon positive regulatory protein